MYISDPLFLPIPPFTKIIPPSHTFSPHTHSIRLRPRVSASIRHFSRWLERTTHANAALPTLLPLLSLSYCRPRGLLFPLSPVHTPTRSRKHAHIHPLIILVPAHETSPFRALSRLAARGCACYIYKAAGLEDKIKGEKGPHSLLSPLCRCVCALSLTCSPTNKPLLPPAGT